MAPKEGIEVSWDTIDDEPLQDSQQPVFRVMTIRSSGFRSVWQRIGRVPEEGFYPPLGLPGSLDR